MRHEVCMLHGRVGYTICDVQFLNKSIDRQQYFDRETLAFHLLTSKWHHELHVLCEKLGRI